MTFTVAELLAIKDLSLTLVAGGQGVGRPIRWAHVSELDDPTPFLPFIAITEALFARLVNQQYVLLQRAGVVQQTLSRLRPEGNEFSLTLSDGDGHRSMLRILVAGAPAGFLVMARAERTEPFHHVVVHHLATAIAHGELVHSLRIFLDHNGNWESAARALSVHQHTLRYRIRRIAELTGRNLDLAADRVELWLALKAAEVLVGRRTAER